MTTIRVSKRLSYTFVFLTAFSAASVTGAAAPELIEGKAPPVLHIKLDCGQHPWNISCVCEDPEEQSIAPATCKALGLEPLKAGMLARIFRLMRSTL
jgi:hypothetical protein